jgi:hypothetical protein
MERNGIIYLVIISILTVILGYISASDIAATYQAKNIHTNKENLNAAVTSFN